MSRLTYSLTWLSRLYHNWNLGLPQTWIWYCTFFRHGLVWEFCRGPSRSYELSGGILNMAEFGSCSRGSSENHWHQSCWCKGWQGVWYSSTNRGTCRRVFLIQYRYLSDLPCEWNLTVHIQIDGCTCRVDFVICLIYTRYFLVRKCYGGTL